MSGLRNGDPKPGERVAVLGLGGLGHIALQLSKAVGLETFAITGQADKKAELIAFGADEVLLAGDDPGAALQAAGGADVILSTTNSAKQIAAAFAGLRPRRPLRKHGRARWAARHQPDDARCGGSASCAAARRTERSNLFEALTLTTAGKVTPKIDSIR